MPKYDFKCKDCEHEFEALASPSKLKDVKCLKCGKETQKLLSTPAIILKGSGFYKNDNSKNKSEKSK